ncbi:DUF3800 domain-containing protein [Candidatus Saccharibacteria bacterium]|nr:DUF3800 domain-containing protein [Candidatus Saccharibacteria bacterium]
MSQQIFIYLDDSGVLHRNSDEQFFIYAGYVFLSKREKDKALALYRNAAKKLQATRHQEIKAHGLKGSNKKFLLSRLSNYESFSCVVNKSKVYPSIMCNKNSIHRYKDYCIKRAAKAKIANMINRKLIDPGQPTVLRFFIDNQHTSTDGIYNLHESIREEFRNGIANFDYGIIHPALFTSGLEVHITFCDSRNHYLVQASDMLANSIFTKYNYRNNLQHRQKNHHETPLP